MGRLVGDNRKTKGTQIISSITNQGLHNSISEDLIIHDSCAHTLYGPTQTLHSSGVSSEFRKISLFAMCVHA